MVEYFLNAVGAVVYVLEAVGVLVIVGGFVVAAGVFLINFRGKSTHQSYLAFRRRSVRGLILGLEFLVAADIIKTITVDYSLESLLILGVIILIRSFLVLALHVELEGRLPWTKSDLVE